MKVFKIIGILFVIGLIITTIFGIKMYFDLKSGRKIAVSESERVKTILEKVSKDWDLKVLRENIEPSISDSIFESEWVPVINTAKIKIGVFKEVRGCKFNGNIRTWGPNILNMAEKIFAQYDCGADLGGNYLVINMNMVRYKGEWKISDLIFPRKEFFK